MTKFKKNKKIKQGCIDGMGGQGLAIVHKILGELRFKVCKI
jgi:hypothetical protein